MSSSLLFPLCFVVQSLFDKEDEKVLEKKVHNSISNSCWENKKHITGEM